MSLPVRPAVLSSPAYPFTPTHAPIKLDQNESPYDFPEALKVLALERTRNTAWNRYPDLNAETVRRAVAKFENWDERGVVVTTGSNVLIGLITELAGMNRRVLTVKPSFSLYALEAHLLEGQLCEVPLRADFSLPLEELKHELETGNGVFYLAQPQAPTGRLDPVREVLELLEAAGDRWIVVIDEAYHQYSGSDYRNVVRGRANVLSLRTFSKAWGLAGLRAGYALTSPELALEIQKLVPPFGFSTLHSAALEVALEHPSFLLERIRETLSERERIAAALQNHPTWTVFPSSTNFMLIRTRDADAAYQGLLERGILVRKQGSNPMLEGCLRVSVGTPEQNSAFIAAALALG